MAALAVTFLANARADVEEMEVTTRDTQARIMLVAACSYVLEASRLGWEPMSTPTTAASKEHVEGHGWIDVRDGGLGPRANTGVITQADRDASPNPVDPSMASGTYGALAQGGQKFPIGEPRRFPMHVMKQPPFAISMRVAENPVNPAAPDSGRSYLRNPDPQPAPAADFTAWVKGDKAPVQNSFGKSWFRILREKTGATFIVTCGAGGTLGYRTWSDVLAGGDAQIFANDKSLFETEQAREVRLWYRIEWNAATTGIEMNYLAEGTEHWFRVSTMCYRGGNGDNTWYSGQYMGPNMGGTIQLIQRLRMEPTNW